MNQVVKFETSKQRKLDWKQEEELRSGKKNHRSRRDNMKGRRDHFTHEQDQ